MNESRIRKIVITGVFSALVIVLGIMELGFIPLPLGAITILQVPVIIAAILEGPAAGFCTGLLFGIFSIVQAANIGTTPVDLAFLHYPWIAIVPRVLIGPGAWLVYSLVTGTLLPRKKTAGAAGRSAAASAESSPVSSPKHVLRETAAVILGAAAGSLINTVLVLFLLMQVLPELSWQIVLALASLNGTVEAGFSAAISLAVILPWKRIPRRGGKAKLFR
ncbi:MAG: ECF transporter S component [Spirochaetaceae bacterium]|nr:ECF transporter S component [Spirochaetaceae bacterium]